MGALSVYGVEMFDFEFINPKKILLVLSILLVAEIPLLTFVDYCSIKCRKGVHTVCMRNEYCGPIKRCIAIPPTVEFRTHMVREHNRVRNVIASGKMKGLYNNTGAKNMNALSYDRELEYIAMCWVNSCTTARSDDCRDTTRFEVGQNKWFSEGYNATAQAVSDWFEAIDELTDAKWIEKYSEKHFASGKVMSYITQLIWAETRYIGCARVQFGEDSTAHELVCNYGPAGNVPNMPVYKMATTEAEIAMDCVNGRNTEYTSLCGTVDTIPSKILWSGVSRLTCIELSNHLFLTFISRYYYV